MAVARDQADISGAQLAAAAVDEAKLPLSLGFVCLRLHNWLLPRDWWFSQWVHISVSVPVEDHVTSRKWFHVIVLFAIVANTVALACVTANDSPETTAALEAVNLACTWIFVAETVLKVVAGGLHGYFGSSSNVFDFAIVAASLLELALAGTAATVAPFRAIRAARVLRLASASKSMHRLLSVVSSVGASILWLAVLLSLMLLVTSLLGRSLFAGAFNGALERGALQQQADALGLVDGAGLPVRLYPRGVPVLESPPDASFDSLDQAFFTTFVVLAGESWHLVAYTLAGGAGVASFVFLAVVQVAGSFLLLNVFTALLLAAFDRQRDGAEAWRQEVEGTAHQLLHLHRQRSRATALQKRLSVRSRPLFASQRSNRRIRDRSATRPGTMPGDQPGPLVQGGLSSSATALPTGADADRCARPPLPLSVPESQLRAHSAANLSPAASTVAGSELAGLVVVAPGAEEAPGGAQPSPRSLQEKEDRAARVRQQQLLLVAADERLFARAEDAAAQLAAAEAAAAAGLEGQGTGVGKPVGGSAIAAEASDGDSAASMPVGPCDCEVTGRNLCVVRRGSPLQRFAARSVLREDPFTGEEFAPLLSCWCRGRRLRLWPDEVILFLIVASCVLVAVDSPTSQFSPPVRDGLLAAEGALAAVFVAEIALGLVAQGACCHRGALWRSCWSVLDSAVVLVSAAALLLGAVGNSSLAADLGWVPALRAVRALRPLRVIARNRGIKVVLNALLASLPAVGSVLLLVAFGLLLFAIAGVQLFAGRFSECNDPAFPAGEPFSGRPLVPGNASAGWAVAPCDASVSFAPAGGGAALPREVVRSEDVPYGFDTLWEALLAVFVAASGEGWPAMMWRAQAIAGKGLQPLSRASPAMGLYFVALTVVVEWFLTQLFVGAVFAEFIKLKHREETGVAALSARQKQFLAAQRFLGALPPLHLFDDPQHSCSRCSRRLADASFFRLGIRVVIAANVAAQVAILPQAPEAYSAAIAVLNAACAAVFVAEAGIELAGRGARQVCASSWGVFDQVVAAGALLELALLASQAPVPGWVRAPLQLLRVSRGLRLAREIPGVHNMLLALWGVRATILSIGGLVLLLVAVAAAVAMNMFGGRAFNASLGPHANFRDFPSSLLTLVRVITGDDWQVVMLGVLQAPPDPTTGESASDLGKALVIPFFIVFVVLFSFLFVALFLILVVEAYSEMGDKRNSALKSDVNAFLSAWAVSDPQGGGWIPFWRLEDTLRSLPPPFGIDRDARHPELMHFVRRLGIRAFNGHVHFPLLAGAESQAEAEATGSLITGPAKAAMLRLLAVLPGGGVRVHEPIAPPASAAARHSRHSRGTRNAPQVVTRALGDVAHSAFAAKLRSSAGRAEGVAAGSWAAARPGTAHEISADDAKRIDIEQLLARADRPVVVECDVTMLLVAQRLRHLVHGFILRRRERAADSDLKASNRA